MSGRYDPSAEGARMDMAGTMSYADYLDLDHVLAAQKPLSESPDEMLFIIQHQTSELWMKLAIHEIRSARLAIHDNRLEPAFKMLTVSRVSSSSSGAWDVLRCMTPSEYTSFRGAPASRQDFSPAVPGDRVPAGNRNLAMLRPHAHDATATQTLEATDEPSLYDEAVMLLSVGFDISAERASGEQRPESETVMAAWTAVYREPEKHWMLYELAEKLVDFEDYFRRWFNHVPRSNASSDSSAVPANAGRIISRRMLDVVLFRNSGS